MPLKILSFATRSIPVRKPKARCGLSLSPPEKKLRMKFTDVYKRQQVLYGQALMAILPMRALKNLSLIHI